MTLFQFMGIDNAAMLCIIQLFVFNSEEPINCEWSEWNDGECSKTCGNGTRTSDRNKVVVEQNGGKCSGMNHKVEECSVNPCLGEKC